jgi:ribonucleoside-triphosphate reductase
MLLPNPAPEGQQIDGSHTYRPLSPVRPPWSTIGYLTYKRTYARRKDSTGGLEEWEDTCNRVVCAIREQLNLDLGDGGRAKLFEYLNAFKCSVAGRFLWQLGSDTVSRLGLASLQNCAFVTVDSPRAFTWAFDMLMLGSGVGYNIQRKYVDKLPQVSSRFARPQRVDAEGAAFVCPDTREGWVDLLRRVLQAAFDTVHPDAGRPSWEEAGPCFTFDTRLIRPKGAPIKGFGGVASGPEELVHGIGQISGILEERRGQALRPIDCLDILNIIGQIVVSGNVRRSAQIAIGDCDDTAYLRAKRWDLGHYPEWRRHSNNSVVCSDVRQLSDDFWAGYDGRGEPYGIINLDLARSCGRTGEVWYPDLGVCGFNPCAEQGLAPYETCCLAEVYLPNIESPEELKDVVSYLYRICKHSLLLPCHHPETEAIVHENLRMGIGVTGYLQASDEQRSWLSDTYEFLRAYDVSYSQQLGVPTSVKLTTVKPSGTLSLLPGVTAGCHPAFSRFLLRRIRIASDSVLVPVIKEAGYHVEQDKYDPSGNTVVAAFPFSFPSGTVVAHDLSAVQQLEVVRRLQREWSDNAVSCTVYYRLEELDEIREYLREHFTDNFKSLSFLLHTGHGFDQAPLEEITEEAYYEYLSRVEPIEEAIRKIGKIEFDLDAECAGGVCPIK